MTAYAGLADKEEVIGAYRRRRRGLAAWPSPLHAERA